MFRELAYPDVGDAVAWRWRTFGFAERLREETRWA
jgi:hypothetical protein